jgi:glycosyltransferase involved in cell wall biosynthesis
MKITYIIPTLGKGGAEDIIVTLANNTAITNNVRLLILKSTTEDAYNTKRLSKKIDVKFLLNRNDNIEKKYDIFLIIWFGIIHYFKGSEYSRDIIHVNLTMGSMLGSIWQIMSIVLRHKPMVIETFHTNLHLLPLSRKIIFILGWNLRNYLVYEIHEAEKEKISRYIFNKKKLVYIPFSADSHLKGDEMVFSSSINKDKFSLLSVSRMRLFEKRIGVMIETLELLVCKYKKEISLVLAGDGQDMQNIKKIVSNKRLSNYVEFLGYIDNPEKTMLNADMYICAMVGNDPGISGLQAAQLSIPVIGVQTIPEMKSDPIKSFNDPAVLAEEINDYINNPNKRIKYGKDCADYVKDKFSVEKMLSSYGQLYDRA